MLNKNDIKELIEGMTVEQAIEKMDSYFSDQTWSIQKEEWEKLDLATKTAIIEAVKS